MGAPPVVRAGQSTAADAGTAIREFHAAVTQPDAALVVFFCSSDYDLDAIAAELRARFDGVNVVGCTTAGEIGPAGYESRSVSGASFAAASFKTASGLLDGLQEFTIGQAKTLAGDLGDELDLLAPTTAGTAKFAFLLIDGLSVREEPVTRSLHHALGGIPMFGGSAADGVRFGVTHVYHGGRFHADSAVLTLVATELPFRVFKTQHFKAETERLVVTGADPVRRIVREINGLPAAEEYARIVGVAVEHLDPTRFAASPVVVVIDGTDYVRSIQKANPDGSLTFYSAIDEGIVLRVARGIDLVGNLDATFDALRADIGPLQLVIGCDCILRNLEMTEHGLKDQVADILRANNVVGFSTYGEQFGGAHVNQTLTGVAIGAGASGGS